MDGYMSNNLLTSSTEWATHMTTVIKDKSKLSGLVSDSDVGFMLTKRVQHIALSGNSFSSVPFTQHKMSVDFDHLDHDQFLFLGKTTARTSANLAMLGNGCMIHSLLASWQHGIEDTIAAISMCKSNIVCSTSANFKTKGFTVHNMGETSVGRSVGKGKKTSLLDDCVLREDSKHKGTFKETNLKLHNSGKDTVVMSLVDELALRTSTSSFMFDALKSIQKDALEIENCDHVLKKIRSVHLNAPQTDVDDKSSTSENSAPCDNSESSNVDYMGYVSKIVNSLDGGMMGTIVDGLIDDVYETSQQQIFLAKSVLSTPKNETIDPLSTENYSFDIHSDDLYSVDERYVCPDDKTHYGEEKLNANSTIVGLEVGIDKIKLERPWYNGAPLCPHTAIDIGIGYEGALRVKLFVVATIKTPNGTRRMFIQDPKLSQWIELALIPIMVGSRVYCNTHDVLSGEWKSESELESMGYDSRDNGGYFISPTRTKVYHNQRRQRVRLDMRLTVTQGQDVHVVVILVGLNVNLHQRTLMYCSTLFVCI